MDSAFGWTYNYSQNGEVVSKTDGADTYTFTYSSELKMETVSLNRQALHKFGYDANGIIFYSQDKIRLYFLLPPHNNQLVLYQARLLLISSQKRSLSISMTTFTL